MLLLTFVQVLFSIQGERHFTQGFAFSCNSPRFACDLPVAVWWPCCLLLVNYFCSIIPDQRPSEMSPSCKNGLIVQWSLVSNSVKYYTSSHKCWSLKTRAASHAIVQFNQCTKQKFSWNATLLLFFFNTKWSFNEC